MQIKEKSLIVKPLVEVHEKKENDITFKELMGAKFHQGGRFKKGGPHWIVVHYTAMAGVGAEKCTRSFAKTSRAVSTHFFCDSKGVFRVVDEQHIAWHCCGGQVEQPIKGKKLTNEELVEYGDRPNWRFRLAAENHIRWKKEGGDFTGNNDSFSVDLCCIKGNTHSLKATDQDWDLNPKAIVNAAKTVAYLCTKYHIDLNHVIRHADATGKPCCRPFVSLSGDKDPTLNDRRWEEFKQMVAEYL